MPLNLSNLSSEDRARLTRLGRRYNTSDVVAQTDRSTFAIARHRDLLARHGFTEDDAADLVELRARLTSGDVTRIGVRTDHREASTSYVNAMRDAQALRAVVRGVFDQVVRAASRGAAITPEAVGAVRASLRETSNADDDPTHVAAHLHHLASVASEPAVAPYLAARGGATFASDCTAAAERLTRADQAAAHGSGTPTETSELDVLDGLAIELCRAAAAAGRAASRATGDDAPRRELALDALYPPRGAKKPEPAPAA